MSDAVKSGIASKSFATRARTIDHLGREQIADCPTAVSELWKNSWDAYARNVKLRIFAEETPIALLSDDGHGMRYRDLIERWLVIGTESKISDAKPTPIEDRNGLPIRPRQGQKGIGRLSSAKLGSILLLISKHAKEGFIAALIDWRMFENPYVNLADVAVATGVFETTEDIFSTLSSFAETLLSSVVDQAAKTQDNGLGLRPAWVMYDKEWLEEDENRSGLVPSQRIIQGMKRLPFRLDHLNGWDGPGTAMLVYDLDDTLKALPATGDTGPVREEICERFQRTLSNFVDPYSTGKKPEFAYRTEITYPKIERPEVVVGAEKAIDLTQIRDLEHQIKGTVGDDGVFRGRIKAFGVSIEGTVEFPLPNGLVMPERSGSRVGPFEIYIASMEFEANNSTHSAAEHARYIDLAADYSGLMIYRDALRILPYGREDNDFFEIEYKRSKNAGRYFWNHRQIFGRISLSRERNPNLKDKAGREGFIDNTAAKTFRAVVSNILDLSARKYFGSASNIRKPRLAEVKATNRAGKAAEEAKKLRERERKLFQKELENAENLLPALLEQVKAEIDGFGISAEKDVSKAANKLAGWRTSLAETSVRVQPSGTARLTPRYKRAEDTAISVSVAVDTFEQKFQEAVENFTTSRPAEIIADQIRDSAHAVKRQTDELQGEIASLQRAQFADVRELAARRIYDFKSQADALGARIESDAHRLSAVMDALAKFREEWLSDNRQIFGIYISALEAVREEIDLETLASVQVESAREVAIELDRLTALAQLGIAVEIASHDLADFDEMANSGLSELPSTIQNTPAVRDIRLGLEGLTDQLKFLSPLRLSGDKIQRHITGEEIGEFVSKFFAPTLAKAGIKFTISDDFRNISLFERPARVFPVFINLVNNSIYWVGTVPRSERNIHLDVSRGEVVVSDSGPGVANEDRDNIFKLFFTRKQRTGRGVGLYLARANLSAGGHSIRYKNDEDVVTLGGASFFIRFSDMQAGGSDA
jgi:signal transduction histidine kinase